VGWECDGWDVLYGGGMTNCWEPGVGWMEMGARCMMWGENGLDGEGRSGVYGGRREWEGWMGAAVG
jgi:hypothetical protein